MVIVFVEVANHNLSIKNVNNKALEAKAKHAAYQSRKRALETDRVTKMRREADAASKASKRLCESQEQAEKLQIQPVQPARETLKVKTRQKSEKLQIKPVKLARETVKVKTMSERRKAADRESKARKNHPHNSLPHLIDSFIAKTKQGPDYVCTSCHRLMYKQSVVPSMFTSIPKPILNCIGCRIYLHLL